MGESDGVHPGHSAAELGPEPAVVGFCMGGPGGIGVDELEQLPLARWEDVSVRRMY